MGGGVEGWNGGVCVGEEGEEEDGEDEDYGRDVYCRNPASALRYQEHKRCQAERRYPAPIDVAGSLQEARGSGYYHQCGIEGYARGQCVIFKNGTA